MTYLFADCELDLDRQELRLDGCPRPTEPQVFGLIVFLIENRDRVVSKDELIEAVWAGRIVSDAALNSRISAARQAMGDDGRTQAIIRTIARRGYRFVAEVDAGEATPPRAGRPRPGTGSETASAPGSRPGSGPAGANGPASVHKPTLAVLPFENISGERDQFYLADGITEDIITALSKNRWLLVLARNATIAFRDRRPPASEIAAQLGADYLLSGSVRRSGERIRISVELVDGGLGSHIWGERYDRRMDDIFDLQDEITETIAARIEPELATAERRRVKRKPPKSLDAWDHYLLGLA
jgi:TolB-like protein